MHLRRPSPCNAVRCRRHLEKSLFAPVGMFGNTSKRVAVVTANGRSLPALMYSIESGTVPNITCTCPPRGAKSQGRFGKQDFV
jgi:hypothetical protein